MPEPTDRRQVGYAMFWAIAMVDDLSAHERRVLTVVIVNTLTPKVNNGALVGLSHRQVAEDTGLWKKRAHQVLKRLCERGVCMVALAGAGRRPTAYDVNPNLAQWDVRWSVPRELVEWRIAEFVAPRDPAKDRVAPRWVAAQTAVVPRFTAALFGPSAAVKRGTTATPAPRWSAAQTSAVARGAPISNFEDQSIDGTNALQAVVAAIVRRTSSPVLGAYAQRLAVALVDVDHEPIVSALGDAPPSLRMPGLVALVEQLAAVQRHDVVAPAAAPWVIDADCPRCFGSGIEETAPGEARPCGCARRSSVAPACENADVGGSS